MKTGNGIRLRYLGIECPPSGSSTITAKRQRVHFPGAKRGREFSGILWFCSLRTCAHANARPPAGPSGQGMSKVEKPMRWDDGFSEKLMDLEKNQVEGGRSLIKK